MLSRDVIQVNLDYDDHFLIVFHCFLEKFGE